MCTKWVLILTLLLLTTENHARAYTNQWAAHIEGGPEVALKVAQDHGFRYLDKVSLFFTFAGTGPY